MIYLKSVGETGTMLRPIVLAALDFASSPIYAHSSFGEIVFNGNTYIGVGTFGGISTASAGADLSRQTISATLSGIPPLGLDLDVITDPGQYQGRDASISIGMLGDDWKLKGSTVIVYDGRMDVCACELGETATVSVSIENYLSDWDRARVSLLTNEEQQRLHPGDKFLEYVPRMAEVELPWGVIPQ